MPVRLCGVTVFGCIRFSGLWWCAAVAGLACGGTSKAAQEPAPKRTAPLPTGGLAGQRVSIFPVTLLAADDSLRWHDHLRDRQAALAVADSIISESLAARAPEVIWVPPAELRRAAHRSAGVAPDPAQLGTSILRVERLVDVPDPLRSQLRALSALAGGRYALIPAALIYRPTPAAGGASSGDAADAVNSGTAELAVVLVDVRVGKVQWRTVARGDGTEPWAALTRAMKGLTPGLP